MSTRDEVIELSVGAQRIAATLVTPATQMPGVLFLHGWGGTRSQYIVRARQVAALGCVCLTVSFRGHEATQELKESVTRDDSLHDVVAAFDTLAMHHLVDPGSIAVVGTSYGGYLGAILTSMRPVRWLALRAPALYKDSDWDAPKSALRKMQDLESYRRQKIDPADNHALAACAAFRGDVLVVESGRDTVVPHQVLENYREALKGAKSLTYRVLDEADHALTDPKCNEAYTTLLVNWLTEMVAGGFAPGGEPGLVRQKLKAPAAAD